VLYVPRIVDALLANGLSRSGAVLVDGPKATGKTESATRQAGSVVRLDVDQPSREAARVDPRLLLEGARPRLLDEWQLFPELWDHVRRAVDDAEDPGQFLLTGSATPRDDGRRHSGAGRFSTLRMRPMSVHELGASSDEVGLQELFAGADPSGAQASLELGHTLELLVNGGWPQQLRQPDPRFVVDYLEQIIHVDINEVGTNARRRDPDKVRACVASLARNVATAAGDATIAKDINVQRATVGTYLGALQRLMITEDQPAFNVHLRSSRNLRSTPHRHFVDPSLATAALRTGVDALLQDLPFAGLLFESMVVRDLRVLSQPLDGVVRYFHTDAHEIDAIVDLPDGRWAAIEVKLGGQELIDAGAASLLAAVDSIDPDRTPRPAFTAVVTATGQYAYRRDDGVVVLPLGTLRP